MQPCILRLTTSYLLYEHEALAQAPDGVHN